MLDDHDRRELEEIEEQLRRNAPGLERALSSRAETRPGSSVFVRHAWTVALGILVLLTGLLGLGQLAAFLGAALVTIGVLGLTEAGASATQPAATRRRPEP